MPEHPPRWRGPGWAALIGVGSQSWMLNLTDKILGKYRLEATILRPEPQHPDIAASRARPRHLPGISRRGDSLAHAPHRAGSVPGGSGKGAEALSTVTSGRRAGGPPSRDVFQAGSSGGIGTAVFGRLLRIARARRASGAAESSLP